jgi:cyclopropane fatty-acyl-phospholipid synthase-like methyltransferase
MIGTYSPSVFDTTDLDVAKNVILTHEETQTTEERWEKETTYTMELLRGLHLDSQKLVVDYGCGVGRISKELIKTYECGVVGIDISTNMRAMGEVYVNSPRFMTMHPNFSPLLYGKVDAVVAIWALQHVHRIEPVVDNIKKMLKPGGKLFVINERRRFVPTNEGWIDDGEDIFLSLQGHFNTEKIDILDGTVVDPKVPARTFWGIFINK